MDQLKEQPSACAQTGGVLRRLRWILTCASVSRPLLLLLIAAFSSSAATGEPANELEDRVKAAFLLNFTKFVEWPVSDTPKPEPRISICVFGDDRFVATLDKLLEGESVGGKRIVAVAGRNDTAGQCSVAFIRRTEKDSAAVQAALGQGVLTVGEGDEFLAKGGMIAFVLENRRVRFDVNQTAVRGSGLRLSSRLLSVARSVQG